ncbi:antitermination protein [Izhakiella australiensis]|uniref:Antitermination protein n=1 Tax=Izhakiella australiensis TaxID=1926881 RepID=A0A1S8YP33_9GAMM|nr:antiterminator Q family protein [Izhakiella australiensis]OON40577.1 antitermination protein [Izhakiella australiensis]
MHDVSLLLQRWGGWAASENSGVNYSSVAAGFRGLLIHPLKRNLNCNDSDGLILDGCISRLKRFNPTYHQLIVTHYLYRVSIRAIARRRRLADGTVRKELQAAEGFIAGVLSGMDITLECESESMA